MPIIRTATAAAHPKTILRLENETLCTAVVLATNSRPSDEQSNHQPPSYEECLFVLNRDSEGFTTAAVR